MSKEALDAWLAKHPRTYEVPQHVLDGMEQVESRGDDYAYNSRTGAQGPMQIVPKTLGLEPNDLTDPAVNRDVGARYMDTLHGRFKGDTTRALRAYNQGPTKERKLEAGGSKEATEYPGKVAKAAAAFAPGTRPDDVERLATRHPKTVEEWKNKWGTKNILTDAVKESVSNAESLLRGAVAVVPGIPGDLEELARKGINWSFGAGGVNVSEEPVLRTTEEWLKKYPQRFTTPTPEASGMEQLGAAMNVGGQTRTLRTIAELPKAISQAGKDFAIAGAIGYDPMDSARKVVSAVSPKAAEALPKARIGGPSKMLVQPTKAEEAAYYADKKAGMPEDELWRKHRVYHSEREGQAFKEVGDDYAVLTGKELPKTRKTVPLSDFLRHDQLYNRIPEAKNIPIRLGTKKETAGAYAFFDPTTKGIVVSPDAVAGDAEKLRQTILHEVQHNQDEWRGVDYGFNPTAAKEIHDERVKDFGQKANAARKDTHFAGNVRETLRELEANPKLSVDEAIDSMLQKATHYGGTLDENTGKSLLAPAERANIKRRIDSMRNSGMEPEEIMADVEMDLQSSKDRWSEYANEQHKNRITNYEAYDRYQRNIGENRANVVEQRAQMTEGERGEQTPLSMMREKPENQITMGQGYGDVGTVPPRVASMSAEMPPVPLREAQQRDRYTLRTLENLPNKGVIPVQTIREQLKRPEVTKAEKDLLESILPTEGNVRAEDLMKSVRQKMEPFKLYENHGDQWADYGLGNIGRDSAEGARTSQWELGRKHSTNSYNNHFDNPDYFAHTRAFTEDGVPHVVEMQSDLVQRAGKEMGADELSKLKRQAEDWKNHSEIWQDISYDRAPALPGQQPLWQFGDDKPLATIFDSYLSKIKDLHAHNPDADMLLTNQIWRDLPSRVKEDIAKAKLSELEKAAAEGSEDAKRSIEYYTQGYSNLPDLMGDGEFMRVLKSAAKPGTMNPYDLDIVDAAVREGLHSFTREAQLRHTELQGKLREGSVGSSVRPMFKNWDRRLVREELGMAAQDYRKAQEAITRLEGLIKDGKGTPFLEEGLAKYRDKVAKPPVVRFATADTVAKVEGWPDMLERAKDRYKKAMRALKAAEDESKRWPNLDYADVLKDAHSDVDAAKKEVESAFNGPRFSKEHQGIYDRYNDETTKYLKSIGGKEVTDKEGHTWWEVPVLGDKSPVKSGRTPLFSIGGGVATGGAATYNAPQRKDDQQ